MPVTRREFILGAVASLALPKSVVAASKVFKLSGIGVNCFDLFYGTLVDERGVRSARDRLWELSDAGVPFVRFAASPFWPKEWRLYPQDRYYRLLDEVFLNADKFGIGLVPSLFWSPTSVSDLFGESITSWGFSASKTSKFARRYVQDIIGRYGKYNSVLHWEFGNEFNLNLDYFNRDFPWPKVNVEMGTPERRNPTDVLTTDDYASLMSNFASWVLEIKPEALISSGSDIPRFDAYNLQQGKSSADTVEQFRQAIRNANPVKNSIASIHFYPDKIRKYSKWEATASKLLVEAKIAAASNSQRLFVGEFGVRTQGNTKDEYATFEMMLNALDIAGIESAALWVYDFGKWQPDWSVTLSNARAWQFKQVLAFNARRAKVAF